MGSLGGIFDGQVVVITGGGGGIGRALCIWFSADGATVVAIGRRASTLDETAELCSRPITRVCADLRRPDACFQTIDEITAGHGRIDVLVNNAGTTGGGSFLGRPFQEWADTIALNVLGPAACCKAVLPQMIRQGSGRIITLTSRIAGTAVPGASAYSASKAAVSALTKCIAAELADRHPNVLINDLIPGPTKTGMSKTGQDPGNVYPYVRKLALLPSGGPSGQIFFREAPYSLFGVRQMLFQLSLWRRSSSLRKRAKTA
jgi:3-oxoacyl-[acyl-carrier protein] reductase